MLNLFIVMKKYVNKSFNNSSLFSDNILITSNVESTPNNVRRNVSFYNPRNNNKSRNKAKSSSLSNTSHIKTLNQYCESLRHTF